MGLKVQRVYYVFILKECLDVIAIKKPTLKVHICIKDI